MKNFKNILLIIPVVALLTACSTSKNIKKVKKKNSLHNTLNKYYQTQEKTVKDIFNS